MLLTQTYFYWATASAQFMCLQTVDRRFGSADGGVCEREFFSFSQPQPNVRVLCE